jgi:hypothetical protein
MSPTGQPLRKHPVGTIALRMEFVVRKLVGHEHHDEDPGSKAERQAEKIDDGEAFEPEQCSQGYLQVVIEHGKVLLVKDGSKTQKVA